MIDRRQMWALLGLMVLAALLQGAWPTYLLLRGAPDFECPPETISAAAQAAGIHQVSYREYLFDQHNAGPPCSIG